MRNALAPSSGTHSGLQRPVFHQNGGRPVFTVKSRRDGSGGLVVPAKGFERIRCLSPREAQLQQINYIQQHKAGKNEAILRRFQSTATDRNFYQNDVYVIVLQKKKSSVNKGISRTRESKNDKEKSNQKMLTNSRTRRPGNSGVLSSKWVMEKSRTESAQASGVKIPR